MKGLPPIKIEFSCDFCVSSVSRKLRFLESSSFFELVVFCVIFYCVSLLSMIVFVFVLIRAIYPAILFRIFLLCNVFPSAFLFSANVFPKDSSEFSSNCLDVLLISLDFILPILICDFFGF